MRPGTLLLLLCLALGAFVAAIVFGSVRIAPSEWVQLLRGEADPITTDIVVELRVPRAAAAFFCGGLLALAGVLLQALLRNPLADPYLLGVSGGASVGALGAMWLGLAGWWVQGSAFAGACIAGGALLLLSLRWTGWQIHRVMLTGVAIAAGCGAVVGLLLTVAADTQVHGMLFWLMGDLSAARAPAWAGALLLALLLATLSVARHLDALTLGELKAAALGVSIRRTRGIAFVAAIAATVGAVMLAGAVGFVGLVVPHLLRLAGTTEHRALLPGSVIAGGALLCFADAFGRAAASPLEFPVGAVTALLGVPVLLFLLARTR